MHDIIVVKLYYDRRPILGLQHRNRLAKMIRRLYNINPVLLCNLKNNITNSLVTYF